MAAEATDLLVIGLKAFAKSRQTIGPDVRHMVGRFRPRCGREIVRLLEIARRFIVEALGLHRLVAVRPRALAALALGFIGLLEEAPGFRKGALDQRLIDTMAGYMEKTDIAASCSDFVCRLLPCGIVLAEGRREIDFWNLVRHFRFGVEDHW